MGCRVRSERSEMLRVVARNGVVVPDPSETLPGRGAWVHPTPACVEVAITRKAFGRALRLRDALNTDEVRAFAELQALAHKETAD